MSQADLARASGLSTAHVSRLENRKSFPGDDSIEALAHALEISKGDVYRAAGLLPSVPEHDERRERILYLAEQLPDEEFEDLIAFIELRIQRSKEREAARAKKARSTATR